MDAFLAIRLHQHLLWAVRLLAWHNARRRFLFWSSCPYRFSVTAEWLLNMSEKPGLEAPFYFLVHGKIDALRSESVPTKRTQDGEGLVFAKLCLRREYRYSLLNPICRIYLPSLEPPLFRETLQREVSEVCGGKMDAIQFFLGPAQHTGPPLPA